MRRSKDGRITTTAVPVTRTSSLLTVRRRAIPLLLYFTSGTTANPKLVEHTHTSYPVGHLSTMYALGLRPGDVHLNVSSPGWAKHAWSCLFAAWNAEATVIAFNYARFDPRALLSVLVDRQVTSLCAPPTVWRMLVQQPLASYAVGLRELLSAGEPLNPEVIQTVRSAWGLTIRDFYGQTETTALVANSPGPGDSERARWGGRCRATRSICSTLTASRQTKVRSVCG